MSEQSIFLAALNYTDSAERFEYLIQACAGNAELLQKVVTLLAAHEKSGQFLDMPALKQMSDAPELTQTEDSSGRDAVDLSYLNPSTKPGSLGTLGHYDILQVLGQGGFGTVLKAFDEKLHRLVAIKVLKRELGTTSPPRKRFLREARAVAAIKHENVIAIHSVEEQPLPYFVMEFIDGSTLQDKMDETGPIGVAEILHIGKQIASGLASAHALGLIHRDIKPANILLEKGAMAKVKITDFGLARAADDASLTQSGTLAGTPLYMAPEQAKGAKLDARADLFSLGSVLYALATGHPPFRARTAYAVLRRVTDDTPRPMQEVISDIPDWLVPVINKLLAKNPADRFQSARELVDVLAKCQSELETGGPVNSMNKRRLEQTVTTAASTTQTTDSTAINIPQTMRRPKWAYALLLIPILAGLTVFQWKGKTRSTSQSDQRNENSVESGTAPQMESFPAAFKNKIGMEFMNVPKGVSWMGGCEGVPGKRKVEMPNDFMIGKYEVTQGQWETIMGNNPSSFSRNGELHHLVADFSDAELSKMPVEGVSWNDCQEFVEKLNTRTMESGWTYRLPTPDEWEYACRGGPLNAPVESAFSYYYTKPTNIYVSEQANYGFGKPIRRPVPVGRFEANTLGLYDMHGNVWEWCGERPNDQSSWDICFCGACWNDNSIFGAQFRERYATAEFPNFRGNGLGFRLVRVSSGTTVEAK